tara:strand:- start:284 stop:433 length:150 start_codon:yes stop_codon:yes gene_type:complete
MTKNIALRLMSDKDLKFFLQKIINQLNQIAEIIKNNPNERKIIIKLQES